MGVVPKPTKSMLIAAVVVAAEVMLRSMLEDAVSKPLVPVVVMVRLPAGVPAAVDTVRIELAPGAMEVGLREAVTPVGSALVTLKFTAPVNPLSAAALIV